MIGTIRKHSAWLWVIIIIVTVASFVVFYRPGGRSAGGGGGSANFGHIYNQPITQDAYVNANRETRLRYFFSNGDWPDRPGHQTDFNVERETYFRLFLIQKAQDYHIKVGIDEVGLEARGILKTLNRGEAVNPLDFEKQILRPNGLTMDDFERTVRHDVEVQQLYTLIGASGSLVTPQEARLLYLRDNTEVSVQTVTFNSTNYLPEVVVSPEAIETFYTNQLAYYRLPERVQVNYVEFSLTNYWEAAAVELAKITNMDQQFSADALQRGTNFFGGASNVVEARKIWDVRYHERQAGGLANQAAYDFANELFKTNQAAYLGTLAAQKGLPLHTTEPFDSRNGPKEFYIPLQFIQAAFRLTVDEPFTTPIPGEKAIYVMALDKRLPSEVPALESIHGRVVGDFRHVQSIILARQATVRCFTTVTNDLAAGKGFALACLDAHVQPELLPPFSIMSQTNDILRQTAFSVLPQHVNFAGTEEGGLVLYVDSRLPINEARLNAELPAFLARLRQSRQQEAFNTWFGREAGTALRDIAALQPKNTPGAAR